MTMMPVWLWRLFPQHHTSYGEAINNLQCYALASGFAFSFHLCFLSIIKLSCGVTKRATESSSYAETCRWR